MASPYNSFTRRGKKLTPPTISGKLIPVPKRPPTGYYDPSIDAQVAAGARGLGDLRIDIDTGKRRGREDYDTALGGLAVSRDRTLVDLLTGERNTREDYWRATNNVGEQFQQLGRQQAEGARARGVTSAGLADRSAQIRAQNQAQAQQGLDTSLDRTMSAIANQRTQIGQDFTTRSGLLGRDFNRQFGAGGDLDLQLARGEREQPLLEADANTIRTAQAKGAGWVPPKARWQITRPPKPRYGKRSGVG